MPYGQVLVDTVKDSLNNVLAPASAVFRNRLINGAMVIDQRNAGASVTPINGQYTLDRFQATLTQASKFTVQQNAGSVTPPTGFINYLGITSSSAYSVLVGDTFIIGQNIEGLNITDLAWGTANAKTVTLSFQVYSSLTGSFGGALLNSATNRSYTFSYSVPTANTWTSISVTIAGDTSGTWLTTNGIGMYVRFGLGSGSTFTQTANSWGTGNVVQPPSTVSVVGTSGATFYITGVQLEVGTNATSFENIDIARLTVQCQRYYAKTFPQGTAPAQNAGATGALMQQDSGSTSYGAQLGWRFPVTMRTTPSTITFYNPSAANANVRNLATNADCTNAASSVPTSDSGTNIVGVSSSGLAGQTLAVHITASAEL
jgi:hypothetical protein